MFETEMTRFYEIAKNLSVDEDVMQNVAISIFEKLKSGKKITDGYIKNMLWSKTKNMVRDRNRYENAVDGLKDINRFDTGRRVHNRSED